METHGAGRVMGDGTLVLDQRVIDGDKPARQREWRIREIGPGRYSGTLSDAIGPVTGIVAGNCLRLTFRMKGGLSAEQQLWLLANGNTAHNLMTVKKFGLTVAVLDETITRGG